MLHHEGNESLRGISPYIWRINLCLGYLPRKLLQTHIDHISAFVNTCPVHKQETFHLFHPISIEETWWKDVFFVLETDRATLWYMEATLSSAVVGEKHWKGRGTSSDSRSLITWMGINLLVSQNCCAQGERAVVGQEGLCLWAVWIEWHGSLW